MGPRSGTSAGAGISLLTSLLDGSRDQRRDREQELRSTVQEQIEVIDANSANIIMQIDQAQTDRIYTDSVNLSGDAIIHFVEQLCKVSEDELSLPQPRVFSLQKIVEISYYNMNRVRAVWRKVWEILGAYFIHVGCHKNPDICNYAIDSLRQLSMKFLEKPELPNYAFQKDFLKPFENIMASSRSVEIRELVLFCLRQFIEARVHHIRSGWKSILQCLAMAAGDSHSSIVDLAFSVLVMLVDQQFGSLSDNVFVETVHCLTQFMSSEHCSDEISVKAIHLTEFCASQLASGALEKTGESGSNGDVP